MNEAIKTLAALPEIIYCFKTAYWWYYDHSNGKNWAAGEALERTLMLVDLRKDLA